MRGLIYMFVLFLLLGKATAQDIHFSQIHASPNQLNPALTGLFNSEFRVIANYKNQWKSATANYNTYFASFDGKVLYLPNRNFLSAGIKAYSDQAGDLNYSKKAGSLSLSAVKSLHRYLENYLCFGAEGGFINQSVDYTRLHVFDMENDPAFQTMTSDYAFDFSAGVNWFLKTRKFLVYAGTALHHINEPAVGFSEYGGREKLYRKVVMNAGGEFKASAKLMLLPSLIYFDQGPHSEWTMGSYVRHKLNSIDENNRRFLYYGLWFRWYHSFEYNSGYDALIASVRLDNNNFTYAISYDLTVSSLTRAARFTGGPELSIIYMIDERVAGQLQQRNKHKKISCPDF
jgi:type IX secretion system PorP/SprF family membrane protein